MDLSVTGLLFVIAWILLECKRELKMVNANVSAIASRVECIEDKLAKLDTLDEIQTETERAKDYLEAISGAIDSKDKCDSWDIKLPWHYGK